LLLTAPWRFESFSYSHANLQFDNLQFAGKFLLLANCKLQIAN
jgi:hypothetical protein